MTRSGAIPILACLGELLLLILVLWRGKRTPLWGPLTALSVVAFGWNFTGMAHSLTGDRGWYWLDITLSPLTAPIAFHLVLAFTGRRAQLRWVRNVAYAWFGALSAYGALAFFVPSARPLYESGAVPLAHLCGAAAVMTFGLVLLVRHERASGDVAERSRTRLLLTALAIATPMALTEVINELGVAVPHLGALGILIGNSLVVLVALQLQLFDRRLGLYDALFAAALASLAVALYLAILEFLASRSALLVFATATLTLLLAAGLRQLVLGIRAQRDRLEHLAQLGRMSSQLGHDLKNPLAALRGAAQFLDGEVAAGRPLTEHRQFLALIVEQADRMQRVIDDYRRLGRLEPAPSKVDLNALVRTTVALQPFAAGGKLEVKESLAPALPECALDADLVSSALHNLLRNACEAMPSGGELLVETRASRTGDEDWVVVAVADTGVGMDARTREFAFDEFFTTRPTGTGLGLSLVRRVASAHGGRVSLQSKEGAGTRVELWLPARAAPSVTLRAS